MDRVSAARERLVSLRQDLSAAEFFCVDCQYLSGENCTHPAIQRHSLDPVKGSVTSHPTPASSARSNSGACGPEAALFEPHPERAVKAKAAWGGVQNAVAVVVIAIAVAGVGAQLLF